MAGSQLFTKFVGEKNALFGFGLLKEHESMRS